MADPRPFLVHLSLAASWAECNGQAITDIRLSRIMRRFDVEALRRMLADRGIVEKAAAQHPQPSQGSVETE
jgi:hypothetical protein